MPLAACTNQQPRGREMRGTQDYQPIGGNHRYAVDQYGGGRNDAGAMAAARTWCAPQPHRVREILGYAARW